MAEGLVAKPECLICGKPSSRVELIAPGQLPADWARWDKQARDSFHRWRDPERWWLLFQGVDAGNGGDAITVERAEQIAAAFALPYSYARVHTAEFYDDAGFCERCDAPYCPRHWHVSSSGYGHCPRGHGKSLDPHWSPD